MEYKSDNLSISIKDSSLQIRSMATVLQSLRERILLFTVGISQMGSWTGMESLWINVEKYMQETINQGSEMGLEDQSIMQKNKHIMKGNSMMDSSMGEVMKYLKMVIRTWDLM